MAEKKTYKLTEYIAELKEREMLLDETVSDDVEITGLTYASGDAKPGTLFVCKGAAFKEDYLKDAVSRGAVCYVSEVPYDVQIPGTETDVPCILVKDIREAMPVLAAMFYCRPWEDMTLVGFGGTKGKSTSAYYMKYVADEWMKQQGKPESAIVSSIDVYDGVDFYESHITTPEAMELQMHMRNALDRGIDFMQMEVSSQALKYNRVDEIRQDYGVFLNVSEDHISDIEHSDFEDYFTSKMRMFEMTDTAIVNLNADNIERVLEAAKASQRLVTFAVDSDAKPDFGAYDVSKTDTGISFRIRHEGTVDGVPAFDEEFALGMPGFFNVENALGVIAAASLMGIPMECIRDGLLKARSKGRMEMTVSKDGNIIAILDYAHNKLSFEKLFSSMKSEYPDYSIKAVFGCPGGKAFNRRIELGNVAGTYAEMCYLASEDPGKEDPHEISKQIAENIEAVGGRYEIIDDRGEAIAKAVSDSAKQALDGKKSLLLITGKGHETRQKIGTEYVDCTSDAAYVEEYISRYNSEKK